jgi:uncharacterized protein YdaU (DUF1376 family)
MAKDPAFLFYPGDYISGTMHLDFECKGAYIDLLMLQFQKDHMTLHMIRHMLGHRFDHIWPQISDKFMLKGGKYWNERLRVEKENRSNYCKSRKNNRNNYKHKSPHMSGHMEDEDEDEDEDINTVKKNGTFNLKIKSKNMSTAKDTEGIPLPFKGPAFESIWSEWLQYRKEARIKNYTPTGLKRLFRGLAEQSNNDEAVAIQIIEQSLTKGWQGLFELKTLPNATNIANSAAGTKAGSVSRGRIQAAKNF